MADIPTTEQDFIARYFQPLAKNFKGSFHLRDDAALITVEDGFDLVTSVDGVAAGTHFFDDDAPADIAWKALAVNVSDLVATGGEPVAYLMSLAFPKVPDTSWMQAFCTGLGAAQSVFKIDLAGGDSDIRPGPIAITITVFGRVPKGGFVTRSGGTAGDILFVSGTIGDAGAGLALRRIERANKSIGVDDDVADFLLNRYHRPKPRTRLIPLLHEFATAAIDVSDGLVKDAGSLAAASEVGVIIRSVDLPISRPAREAIAAGIITAKDLVTAGGDYEILASVPAVRADDFAAAAESAGVLVTPIGTMTTDPDVIFADHSGSALTFDRTGFDHFTDRG